MLKSAHRAILIVGAMSFIDGMPESNLLDLKTSIESIICILLSILIVAYAIHND